MSFAKCTIQESKNTNYKLLFSAEDRGANLFIVKMKKIIEEMFSKKFNPPQNGLLALPVKAPPCSALARLCTSGRKSGRWIRRCRHLLFIAIVRMLLRT